MGKLIVYTGGAAGLVLLGWWLGRRKAGLSSELGLSSGISQVDYVFRMPRLYTLAARQVVAAVKGKALSDYRRAEDRNTFLQAPAFDAQAYYHAGYWTAVASRLLRDRKLARKAGLLLGRGGSVFAIPGSSLMTGGVAGILAEARRDIEASVGTREDRAPKVAGVLAILGQHGSPGMVEHARQREEERSGLTEGARRTGEDLVQVASDGGGAVLDVLLAPANFLRAALGLSKPSGEPYSPWKRWGARAGIAALVLIGAGLYFRPQIAALRATKQRWTARLAPTPAAPLRTNPAPTKAPAALLPAPVTP